MLQALRVRLIGIEHRLHACTFHKSDLRICKIKTAETPDGGRPLLTHTGYVLKVAPFCVENILRSAKLPQQFFCHYIAYLGNKG